MEPKSLTTSEANYSEFHDRDAREDIHLGPAAPHAHSGLHLAKSINAFAVALCDNVRRIRDVAEQEQKKKKEKEHVTQRDRGIDIGSGESFIHNTVQLASHPKFRIT